ncbi:hypothetical protein SAMN02746009_04017 [Hymenobacter psychrotolerans DSM 18569]|uniref:Uncharacterized protein n=1 Tax=Hymenobacter psychrotolerans DSM 18569 TaxID=1121959 RepID=A0A1M7GE39_9BACT|nr:hypothetical protein SAMN02746009_04017 [Hymenobacter psychrotolerans DSM 18569]
MFLVSIENPSAPYLVLPRTGEAHTGVTMALEPGQLSFPVVRACWTYTTTATGLQQELVNDNDSGRLSSWYTTGLDKQGVLPTMALRPHAEACCILNYAALRALALPLAA